MNKKSARTPKAQQNTGTGKCSLFFVRFSSCDDPPCALRIESVSRASVIGHKTNLVYHHTRLRHSLRVPNPSPPFRSTTLVLLSLSLPPICETNLCTHDASSFRYERLGPKGKPSRPSVWFACLLGIITALSCGSQASHYPSPANTYLWQSRRMQSATAEQHHDQHQQRSHTTRYTGQGWLNERVPLPHPRR